MTARAGEVKNGELWVRCPFCGDSPTSPWKAHMSIDLERGLYHCHRCHVGGILPEKTKAQLLSASESATDFEREVLLDSSQVIPGPATSRKSLLDRYHYRDADGQLFDAFEMKDPKTGERTGFHLRKVGEKTSLTHGSGLSWSRKTKIISSPSHPLFLVEGPYDVVEVRDICCFGLVSSMKHLSKLVGQYVVLTPDGDVWQKPDLLRSLITVLKRPPTTCTIIGVEYIPDGLDPDEVPRKDRQLLRPNEILSNLSRKELLKYGK